MPFSTFIAPPRMPSSTPRSTLSMDGSIRRVAIEFTGTGSEYFRIWIVNLLLIVLTLGFYWPWAKVRRMRYFWGHTLIDGDPLDFHGNPWQMFKGWMLLGLLFGLYNMASNFSPVAGLIGFLILAVLWPALWRSSLAFRLGNTSWRGLRFRFVGSSGGAYAAMAPLMLAALPLMVLGLWMPSEEGGEPPRWVALSVLAIFGLLLGLMPWLLWRLKRYQHDHYALGPLQTEFRASLGAFYGIAFKSLFVLLAPVLLLGLAGWAIMGSGLQSLGQEAMRHLMAAAGMIFMLLVLLVVVMIQPWWTTRMQNLVWTKTGNSQMRFISALRFRHMLWLSVKNSLLIMLTLGLYWPFAAVARARLRLEAVHVRSRIDLGDLLATAQASPAEAAGEAAGDFFGFDLGL